MRGGRTKRTAANGVCSPRKLPRSAKVVIASGSSSGGPSQPSSAAREPAEVPRRSAVTGRGPRLHGWRGPAVNTLLAAGMYGHAVQPRKCAL